MNFDTINRLVASMATIPFFPAEETARLALVDTLGEMAENEDQVRWLVRRMRNLYSQWPGEREMRACFCSRYRPKDGLNAYSTVYLDGLPSEHPQTQPLLPGRSADPQLAAAVSELAEMKRLPAPSKPFPVVTDAPMIALTREQKHYKPITEADVRAAVERLHQEQGK